MDLDRFKDIFWDAFHRPNLLTEKFEQKFQELEPINDQLAGPLYAIFVEGHCNYIFEDKVRFSHIKTLDDLIERMTNLVKHYKEQVDDTETSNEQEEKDKEVLYYQIDLKMELVDIAFQILQ